MKALVSIHDVMPHTFEEVRELVEICQSAGVSRPTLLVVPGLEWSPPQLDQIRSWEEEGLELAGHGWIHRHGTIRTWWHRFHSLFLSRNVAEHLSRPENEILELMSRCYAWFDDQGLNMPKLYVPPAWALGSVATEALVRQPFEMVETFRGVLRRGGHFQPLPLVGYEADTWLRACALTTFNRWNQSVGGRPLDRPLRIGIHPFDHRLLLRRALQTQLERNFTAIGYKDLPKPAPS